MRLVWPLLLLLFSCTKYASFEKDAIVLEIKGVEMEITHLKELTWRVGQRREKVVSQSLSFIVDMPRLKPEDLDYLAKERGVDAWVVRIRSEKRPATQDLGSIYIPFEPTRTTRGIDQKMPASASFIIQYAAAYPSERFRTFKCPAFGHTKRLSSFDVEGKNDEFSIIIGQSLPYPDKLEAIELRPKAFNGGLSLTGNHFIEIAPFNVKKKTTMGPFKRIPMFINVSSEEEVSVPSCAGIRSEHG
jgi:hypothetical protein